MEKKINFEWKLIFWGCLGKWLIYECLEKFFLGKDLWILGEVLRRFYGSIVWVGLL